MQGHGWSPSSTHHHLLTRVGPRPNVTLTKGYMGKRPSGQKANCTNIYLSLTQRPKLAMIIFFCFYNLSFGSNKLLGLNWVKEFHIQFDPIRSGWLGSGRGTLRRGEGKQYLLAASSNFLFAIPTFGGQETSLSPHK